MKAVVIRSYDGPTAVDVVDVPTPHRGADDVLVQVHAAGVSFPELLQTRGRYQFQPELPFTPGAEVAGVVLEAPRTSQLQPGDPVCGYPGRGGFAEQAVVPVERALPLPPDVSFAAGAAFPLNYLTTHFALAVRHQMQPGCSVVVQGAAGGIGTAMIQFAKARGAGDVVAVVSSAAKAAIARQAGADAVVDSDGFLDAVKRRHPDGVDVVVDPVGGDRFTDNLRALAPTGRVLVIGFAAGDIPVVKVNRLLLNNVDVVGVGWGAYALGRPGFLARQWTELTPLITGGALAPIIGAEFDLDDAVDALVSLDERRAVGKIVLRVEQHGTMTAAHSRAGMASAAKRESKTWRNANGEQ